MPDSGNGNSDLGEIVRRLQAIESKQDDVKHDTRNIRSSSNALPQLLNRRNPDEAPSNMAKLALAGVITLIVGFVGGALTWGTVNLMKVGPMEANVVNLQRMMERVADSVQVLRNTATAAEGATAVRSAEITGLSRRLDEINKSQDEFARAIGQRFDAVAARIATGEERDLQLERRIADLLLRRGTSSPPMLLPEPPEEVPVNRRRTEWPLFVR